MINKQLINLSSPASSGGNAGEEGLILHLDANDVDSYDGDGSEWVDITNHEYTPTTNVSEHFNTVIWDGDSTVNRSITGVGFQPDLVWIKNRNNTYWNLLHDSLRPDGNDYYALRSDGNDAQFENGDRFNGFDSDGFTVSYNGLANLGKVNRSGYSFVAWCFKAGGAAVSNTDGTITSQVSANNDLGFSIVKYTGNLNNTTSATGAPIGHGLGTTPELIIFKNLGVSINWHVYSKDLANWGTRLYLNETSAADNVYSSYPIANPTGSVFYTNYLTAQNVNNHNYIAYCFASKRGVSKVGSYVGTGAAGNKVYTGFEPAFIMTKRSSSAGDNWNIIDNVRDTDPDKNSYLRANLADAEVSSSTSITFNRDGFTLNGGSFNTSSQTHIYYAIAKNTNETSLIPDTDLELHLDAASFDGSTNTPSTWTALTGNNGSITGATFDSELGNYLDFDGSNDYVEISNASSIIPAGSSFSIEVWVNAKSNTENKYWGVVSATNGTSPFGGWMIYNHYNTDNWGISMNKSGTWVSLDTGVDIVKDKWEHLVYTYDGSYMKLYVNGELRFNSYQLGSLQYNSGSQNIYIGRNHTNYSPIKVGQVRIYSSATLTQDQIRQNFNYTKNDYPNGFDGTITNATWNPDGYFNFDGNGDYISLNQGNNMSGGFFNNFSISYWVKLDTTSTLGRHFYAYSSSSNYIILYYNHSEGGMRLGGSNINTQQASYTMSANTWYHIVLTQSSENVSLYVDTSRKINSNQSIGTYDDMKVTLGAADQSGSITNSLDGKISKFKLYDKILTTTEIDTLHSEGA